MCNLLVESKLSLPGCKPQNVIDLWRQQTIRCIFFDVTRSQNSTLKISRKRIFFKDLYQLKRNTKTIS